MSWLPHTFNSGIVLNAIEAPRRRAVTNKASGFRKPASVHSQPLRMSTYESPDHPANVLAKLLSRALKHRLRSLKTNGLPRMHQTREQEFLKEIQRLMSTVGLTRADVEHAVDKTKKFALRDYGPEASASQADEYLRKWWLSIAPAPAHLYPLRVTRHERGLSRMEKFAVWRLPHFSSEIVVMGTSNIGRIQQTPRPDVEAHSFPGARLANLSKVVEDYRGPHPQVLIVSGGVNDRVLPVHIAQGDLWSLMMTVRQAFPRTHVIFHMLNFSPHLPAREKHVLHCLNEVFHTPPNAAVAHPLPDDQFGTQSDLVH